MCTNIFTHKYNIQSNQRYRNETKVKIDEIFGAKISKIRDVIILSNKTRGNKEKSRFLNEL